MSRGDRPGDEGRGDARLDAGVDGAIHESVADLRAAFDRTFSRPPPKQVADPVRVILVGAGADRFALPLEGLAAVERLPTTVPMPSTAGADAFTGLAGVRGGVLPVWSLAALVGLPPAARAPAWVATLRGRKRVGLAFDHLWGHHQLPAAALRPPAPGADRAGLVESQAVVDGGLHDLLRVDRLVALIRTHVAASRRPRQERA